AWPRLAGSTQPMITSLTSAGAPPDSPRAARMAVAPSFGVGTPVNWPRNEPMAVRLEPTMTMLGSDMEILRWVLEGANAVKLSSDYRSPAGMAANTVAGWINRRRRAFHRDSVVPRCARKRNGSGRGPLRRRSIWEEEAA